ncbi:ABC transporter substrate-binding protein [Devosia pacifica]|uniref:ABC transporter substrate-binding protein n=1 Tax=Devosia pacifica TaxID=1335967 RepID=A0A918RUW5_9HYPH|nr:extracellular solute-binding protein [Devosia pacifica]GHA13633.1 ABC transporter substrate-binding protein [Devosia pacifica]
MPSKILFPNSRPRSGQNLSRRSVLKGMGSAALVGSVSMPFISRAAAQTPLRISNFGGFFEQAFAEHVYPAFTEATGIPVQSIPQSGGAQFLIQLAQANQAGAAPMDICCAGQAEVIRGRAQNLWASVDEASLPNLSNLMTPYVYRSDEGVDGVGAMGWYMTFLANPNEFETLPTSWKELWGDHPGAWGINSGGTSPILDITAATYFDGASTLDTEEGCAEVLAKIGELKPNTRLWWSDEGSMQSAYQNEEVIGGTYYHDVAMIMKSEGTPIESIFPEEGAVQGYNAWCIPSSNEVTDSMIEFLNWSATPEAHELIARHVSAAPLIDRSQLDLTDEEFAAVSSQSEPILIASEAKVKNADFLAQEFIRILSS